MPPREPRPETGLGPNSDPLPERQAREADANFMQEVEWSTTCLRCPDVRFRWTRMMLGHIREHERQDATLAERDALRARAVAFEKAVGDLDTWASSPHGGDLARWLMELTNRVIALRPLLTPPAAPPKEPDHA